MIDLHTHTTYSDGRQSIEQLLKKAEEQKLEYISITDHQTVGAYRELENPDIRNLYSGKIIPGIELLFEYNGIVNEVLGYGIDIDKMAKANFLSRDILQNQELFFLQGLHAKFTELGFKLPPLSKLEDELVKGRGIARQIIGRSIVSPENTKLCESMGILDRVGRLSFYNNEVLTPTGKHFVPQTRISLGAVCNAIHDTGGLVFMAHIFRANRDMSKNTLDPRIIDMLDYAVENKLIDGIEVYYQSYAYDAFTKSQIEYLEKYCKEKNLLLSGGSDNHYTHHELSKIPQSWLGDWLGRVTL